MLISIPFFYQPTGLVAMIYSRDALLTDYVKVGGLTNALLNVIVVMLFTITIKRINHVETNGFIIAGLMTTLGFSFFGKNIMNILPIYAGVYAYARYNKRPFKQYFGITLFATGLAPLATIAIEYGVWGLLLGCTLAFTYGFLVVPLASHIIRFHNGYLLYNVGFTGGLMAILFTAVLRTIGVGVDVIVNVSTDPLISLVLSILLVSVSCYFIIYGYFSYKPDAPPISTEYRRLMEFSGRAITDYYKIFGKGLALMNIGIVGLMMSILVICLPVPVNGATVGSIFSVMGFAAFGKHPKNIIPLIIGAVLMLYIGKFDLGPSTVITLIFVTGLAPIAGEFGFIAGIIAGVLHFSLVSYTADWQGGANLYNNGFAGGFVAGIMTSIMDSMWKRKSENG